MGSAVGIQNKQNYIHQFIILYSHERLYYYAMWLQRRVSSRTVDIIQYIIKNLSILQTTAIIIIIILQIKWVGGVSSDNKITYD